MVSSVRVHCRKSHDMCEIRFIDHSVCLEKRVYFQCGWGCSVSADKLGEVRLHLGEVSYDKLPNGW